MDGASCENVRGCLTTARLTVPLTQVAEEMSPLGIGKEKDQTPQGC